MNKLLKAVFVIFLLLTVCYPLATSQAAVPRLINYQGRLTDNSGNPLNGSHSLTFRIFDAEAAGNLLWEETQTSVVIQKGVFNILLGSVTNINLPFDKPYWLEIKVDNEVMSPRQRIATVAYAIRAEHGVPKGVVVMWAGKISDIPEGWALCDGYNGTPDLRDRFIVGARQDDSGVTKTNVTGELTKSGDGQILSHSHTENSAGLHSHNINYKYGVPSGTSAGSRPGIAASSLKNDSSTALSSGPSWYGWDTGVYSMISAGNHIHTINSSGGGKNVAVYYALAYIIKTQ